MKVLLDTCAFLWLTTDSPEFSEKAKVVFQDTENVIYLSSVSIWEMLVKHQLGKLPLPTDADSLLNCNVNGISSNFYRLMKKQCFI
jgi:PIN domain nuclease of toxin-antitoxin system